MTEMFELAGPREIAGARICLWPWHSGDMDHRSRLRRRLRSLAVLELVNIPLQAGIWFGYFGLPVTAVNATGFGLFALLLTEGAAYWMVKLGRLGKPGALPGRTFFVAARVANIPLLAAGVTWAAWATTQVPLAESLPGLLFALFAAFEHVNYFHVQLMYDNRADLRRLRAHGLGRAHLARDLARSALGNERGALHRSAG